MSVVYDAGALVAADRGDHDFWRKHRARLEEDLLPVTTAPAVAQVSRSPRQAQLHRLLRGCEVVPFDAADIHEVGALLAATGTTDVVDAHVALTAIRRQGVVVTSDPDDIARLVAHADKPPRVIAV